MNNEAAAVPAARAGKNENAPNELLEKTTHVADEWMDGRTKSKAASGDPSLATVGKCDGPPNGGRESGEFA